jgi:purine nucleosidase
LDLLERSIQEGATVVAIGPYTNLALLEVARPGRLGRVPVVAMGGWTQPPAHGLPAWGPEMDWNVQFDTQAAQILAATTSKLTLVTLPMTLKAHLRAADLPRLRACGPLGELLARQGEAHGEDFSMAQLSGTHAGLPDGLLKSTTTRSRVLSRSAGGGAPSRRYACSQWWMARCCASSPARTDAHARGRRS